jgi:uroporphyrinogen-III synthase
MAEVAWRGCQILVTRPAHQAGGLVAAIEGRGGEALAFPTIEIRPPADTAVWERVANRLNEFDWLVFASTNAVDGFDRHLTSRRLDWPSEPAYAAIGIKTAAALEERLGRMPLTPPDYRSESFLEMPEMAPEVMAGKRVLLVRGETGRELLPTTLEQRGAEVERLPVYARRRPDADPGPVTRALAAGSLSAAVFSSPETFTNLLAMLDPEARARLREVPLVAISPVTAAAITEQGFPEPVVAPEATEEGLLRALEGQLCPHTG